MISWDLNPKAVFNDSFGNAYRNNYELFLGGFHALMQFGAADAIDLGTAFRAGPENDSAAALVETGGGILDLTLSLTLYTIAFH